MVFNVNKSFEVDNGIVLDAQSGVGLFSGSGVPTGTQAPQYTRYYDSTTGVIWYKYGTGVNDWRKAQPGRLQDHITLLAPGSEGERVNRNSYSTLAYGHINGSANLENNTDLCFQIVASKSGSGTSDIRLFDITNNTTLGSAISVTSTNPEYYTIAITLPTGNISVEVQGRKSGNSTGTLYWASVEYIRTES